MEKLILENIKQDNFDKKKVAEMYEDFKNKSLEGYEKTLREITDYLGEGDEVSIQKGVEEKR